MEYRVWTHYDKEYHFKEAIKTFDPSVKLKQIDDYFSVETKLDFDTLCKLSSVKKVEKGLEPSGLYDALRYVYGNEQQGRDAFDGVYMNNCSIVNDGPWANSLKTEYEAGIIYSPYLDI